MATLNEIAMRIRAVAADRGSEDAETSPVMKRNGLTIEALIHHASRFAISRALVSGNETFEDVARTHAIEVTENTDGDQEGELPNGVLRQLMNRSYLPASNKSSYLRDREFRAPAARRDNLLKYYTHRAGRFFTNVVAPVIRYGDLSRTETGSKAAISDALTNDAGSLDALTETGWRIVIKDADSVELVNALILEISDPSTGTVFRYREGDSATGTAAAQTMEIYETDLELVRSLTIAKAGATNNVTDETGTANVSDVGLLLIGTLPNGDIAIRAIVADAPDVNTLQIYGDLATVVAASTDAALYRIKDPTVDLRVPSTFDHPVADGDTELDLSRKVTDDTVIVAADVIAGTLKLSEILDQ